MSILDTASRVLQEGQNINYQDPLDVPWKAQQIVNESLSDKTLGVLGKLQGSLGTPRARLDKEYRDAIAYKKGHAKGLRDLATVDYYEQSKPRKDFSGRPKRGSSSRYMDRNYLKGWAAERNKLFRMDLRHSGIHRELAKRLPESIDENFRSQRMLEIDRASMKATGEYHGSYGFEPHPVKMTDPFYKRSYIKGRKKRMWTHKELRYRMGVRDSRRNYLNHDHKHDPLYIKGHRDAKSGNVNPKPIPIHYHESIDWSSMPGVSNDQKMFNKSDFEDGYNDGSEGKKQHPEGNEHYIKGYNHGMDTLGWEHGHSRHTPHRIHQKNPHYMKAFDEARHNKLFNESEDDVLHSNRLWRLGFDHGFTGLGVHRNHSSNIHYIKGHKAGMKDLGWKHASEPRSMDPLHRGNPHYRAGYEDGTDWWKESPHHIEEAKRFKIYPDPHKDQKYARTIRRAAKLQQTRSKLEYGDEYHDDIKSFRKKYKKARQGPVVSESKDPYELYDMGLADGKVGLTTPHRYYGSDENYIKGYNTGIHALGKWHAKNGMRPHPLNKRNSVYMRGHKAGMFLLGREHAKNGLPPSSKYKNHASYMKGHHYALAGTIK